MESKIPGARQVRGIWFPEHEEHLTYMVENKSKVGDVDGRGTYQVHKLRRAMDHISPGRRRVAIDIGAHVGLWSMHLVKEFDLVEAFEPIPALRELFVHNVFGADLWADPTSGQVTAAIVDKSVRARLHAVGLGASPGEAKLAWDPLNTGNTHVSYAPANGAGVELITARIMRLDDFDFPIVDFIKIDVEGFELEVVKGAAETIARCRPVIVVEQKGNDAKFFGGDPGEALAFLKDSLGMTELGVISGDYILGF